MPERGKKLYKETYSPTFSKDLPYTFFPGELELYLYKPLVFPSSILVATLF